MKPFPKIMGILNVTPDSFSDGGLYDSHKSAIAQAVKMIEDGADIIDVGGESTRPGAKAITTDEEIKRVMPVIEGIKKTYPDSTISIDTTKYDVAVEAVEAGAEIINDISSLRNDPRIGELASEKNLSLILMHMQGKPRTMQENPIYKNVVQDVFSELKERRDFARSLGVNKIIGDVGIGFGKTLFHNLELLRNYNVFENLGIPLMLGVSRKSFLGMITGIENPKDRDLATVLLHAILLEKPIDIIRVHNVENISLLKRLYKVMNRL